MRTFSLSTYTIRVTNTTGTKNYKLDSLEGGEDFHDIVSEYIKSLSRDISHHVENQMLFRVLRSEEKGRSISGFIEKGEYGIESDLIDVSSESISYERSVDDAEMIPFYFLIVIPNHADEGVIAFQKSGVMGIKTYFEIDFKEYAYKKYPEYRIQINPLIPEQLLDLYLGQGRVTKVRLIKFGIPSDITDAVDIGHEEHEGTTELQIRAKRNKALEIIGKIKEVVEGRRDVKNFIEIKSFDYDNVKVEVEIDGRYRTLDLSNPDHFRALYDISKDIEIIGGHPEYDSINSVAREIVNGIIDEMGLTE